MTGRLEYDINDYMSMINYLAHLLDKQEFSWYYLIENYPGQVDSWMQQNIEHVIEDIERYIKDYNWTQTNGPTGLTFNIDFANTFGILKPVCR